MPTKIVVCFFVYRLILLTSSIGCLVSALTLQRSHTVSNICFCADSCAHHRGEGSFEFHSGKKGTTNGFEDILFSAVQMGSLARLGARSTSNCLRVAFAMPIIMCSHTRYCAFGRIQRVYAIDSLRRLLRAVGPHQRLYTKSFLVARGNSE